MKRKKNFNSQFGILFFITGLSGAGKSSLARLIKPYIQQKFGKTIIISSERLRNIFKLKGFSQKAREEVGKNNIKLLEYIINQKVNIIYDAIGLREKLRKIKRKNFKNYCEIYIKSSVKKTFELKKKPRVYKENGKNIVGLHIKAEIPKRPDILIVNNYKKNLKDLCSEMKGQIEKKINFY
tara:strand:- start:1051 stop:1593 length:543 start_codon:yes stop_codon:yes gene_type:complete